MPRVYANNISTTTAADITDVGTTLVITSATGLPTLSGSDYYYLTLDNLLGTVEIVKVTARAGTSLTIVRGQEGTTGVAWLAGAVIEMRETAASYTPDSIISGQTLTAATVATDDKILVQDTSDSDNVKTVTAQSIADLAAAAPNTFGTVAVSGQSDVVADSSTDTLTLAAGTNITLTTNATTDTITIATAATPNVFNTLSVSGQSDVVADSSTDTLTLVAGTGMTLTTNASTDTITFASSGGRDRDAKTDISTSGGTTTLTSSSTFQQRWTGSTAGDIVKMPVTSTLSQGYAYLFINDASVSVAVQSSGANAILSIPGGSAVLMTCIDTTVTTAAGWTYTQLSKMGGIYYPFRLNTGNITLTGSSAFMQYYEDSGTVNNTMPVASTLVNGQSWMWVNNKSSGTLNVYASDNVTLLLAMPIGTRATFTCKDNTGGTGATPWVYVMENLATAPIIYGTGVKTFLATPSSANLAAAVTDETGSGALVFATSPLLVTPILGTPTSGVMTNCTATGGLRSFQILTSGVGATYTKPANVTSILVEVIGGGGGGGGVATGGGSTINYAGGGGAGGYARLYIASAASTYTYTVGVKGNGGAAGSNAGSNGSTTTFGASLQATGGTGGPTGTAGASGTTAGGAAGVGSNGNINAGGTFGGYSYWASVAIGGVSGCGGQSYFGGGAQGSSAATAGANATGYGSGGAGAGTGAATDRAGGNGSDGVIIVWEFS